MSTSKTHRAGSSQNSEVEVCDLCIVGAGIAGLNALFVAAEYLPKNAKVILIDRNKNCGGMWNTTYDFVRLHQPHPMFTAGDISWKLKKPRHYLASRSEVVAHFMHCVDIIRNKINLVELYGTNFNKSEEIVGSDDLTVTVRCSVTEGDGRQRTIDATRLINAIGYDIPVPDSLAFTSHQLISTTPQLLMNDVEEGSCDHVYVVGGGKTGMDTVMALSRQRPNVKVSMISGQGTVFGRRDLFAPEGLKRWWHGSLLMQAFGDVAMRFDGNNEENIFQYFRDNYATSPDGTGEQFFFGLLSDAESTSIDSALQNTYKDYLSDVVDAERGLQMVMKSGKSISVEPGSVFVNCTGTVFRETKEYEPYISTHGAILTISSRSAVHFLSSVSSYFLTHLFYRDQLPDADLYAIDFETLLKKGRKVWHLSVITISFMNVIVLINKLPFKVMDGCGLDLDKWFPLYRRAASLIDIKLNQKRYLSHCRRTLDRVGERTGVRCGILD